MNNGMQSLISSKLIFLRDFGGSAFFSSLEKHEVMNVACGDQISLNEMVHNLNELSQSNIKPIYGPERTGDVRHSKASIEKIEKFLGYKPKLYFKDGLDIVFNWYKEVYEN